MIAALLTTLFFSLSSVFAARSIRHVGATTANLGRLLVAVVCLGIFAHVAGGGLGGVTSPIVLPVSDSTLGDREVQDWSCSRLISSAMSIS